MFYRVLRIAFGFGFGVKFQQSKAEESRSRPKKPSLLGALDHFKNSWQPQKNHRFHRKSMKIIEKCQIIMISAR